MSFSRQVYRQAQREIDRPWHAANLKAKLPERREQCQKALQAAAKAYASHMQEHPRTAGLDLQAAINDALTKFWRGERMFPRVRRILRELDAARRQVLRRAG